MGWEEVIQTIKTLFIHRLLTKGLITINTSYLVLSMHGAHCLSCDFIETAKFALEK